MAVDSRITVNATGSGKPVWTGTVTHAKYPKSDRVQKAVDAVERWARHQYPGRNVFVDPGSLKTAGDDGQGHVVVDGIDFAHFSVAIIPEPVPAASLFGGGR